MLNMKQDKGLQDEQLRASREILDDILWMAIRYAHGRQTMAPSTVRSAFKKIKEIWPDFKIGRDNTIKPPTESDSGFREDYLDDLYENDEK